MRLIIIIVIASSVSATGCAAVGTYFFDRGNDFVDMFAAKAAFGLGLHSGVNFFGLIGVHSGMAKTSRAGFEGRNFVQEEHAVIGAGIYSLTVPIISAVREDYERYNNSAIGTVSMMLGFASTGDEKVFRDPEERISIVDAFLEFSTADYEMWLYSYGQYVGANGPVENPLSRGIWDYGLRVSTTFILFGFEVGFNPVELGDFILGLVTIDLMGDDAPGRE